MKTKPIKTHYAIAGIDYEEGSFPPSYRRKILARIHECDNRDFMLKTLVVANRQDVLKENSVMANRLVCFRPNSKTCHVIPIKKLVAQLNRIGIT
jgi:hypothetical protein